MNFSSVTGKNWILKEYNHYDAQKLSETFSISNTTAKLLSIRKKNIENINFFLNPTIKDLLPNPLTLKDMDRAVERAYQCIKSQEQIGIFGDYDVDGATSTALLTRYFLTINQKIKTYIPDRKKEGYGPSLKGFDKLIKSGSKVIFTVDCGTLSFEPIKDAQKKNVDVIVLDHHQSDIKLPNACAIVNPNRYDDNSNLNYLCAAGVCFVFLVALNQKLRKESWFIDFEIDEPNMLNFLDLVSLGTVCDVVPLVGLNRAIVKQGLKIIKKRSNLGLKTLYDICSIKHKPTTYDLGYKLGPRINAGGRLGKSSHGADLLISNDPQKAYKLATDLDIANTERQSIEANLTEEVFKEAKKFISDPVLVLSGKNWHEGVIGIVASRIKEKYNKPTIIISLQDSKGKGSARSIFGFDIGAQIINAVQLNIIDKGGGHKMAGGFTINENNIKILREYLIKNYKKAKLNSNNTINLYLDSIIAPSALNENFYLEVDRLSPFGSGNSEPRFIIENLKVLSSKLINKKHIKSVLLGKDGTAIKCLTFNAIGSPLESFLEKKNKKNINIAGKMHQNDWQGEIKIEFIIDDISIS